MKKQIITISLITAAMLFIGCGKTDKHYHTNVTNPIGDHEHESSGSDNHDGHSTTNHLGTETHGGDIDPSIILKAYDNLTVSSEEIDKKNIDFGWTRYTFKEDLTKIWEGVKLALRGEMIKDPKLLPILKRLVNGIGGYDILKDIDKSPLKIVINPKSIEYMLDDERNIKKEYLDQYNFGYCLSDHGSKTPNPKTSIEANKENLNQDEEMQESSGSTQLGVPGSEICLSASKIAIDSKEDFGPRYYAIDAHERAHHFGFQEHEAYLLQNFIDEYGREALMTLRGTYTYLKNEKRDATENIFINSDVIKDQKDLTLKINYKCTFKDSEDTNPGTEDLFHYMDSNMPRSHYVSFGNGLNFTSDTREYVKHKELVINNIRHDPDSPKGFYFPSLALKLNKEFIEFSPLKRIDFWGITLASYANCEILESGIYSDKNIIDGTEFTASDIYGTHDIQFIFD